MSIDLFWEYLCRVLLGQKSASSQFKLFCEVVSVAVGVKDCFLFDLPSKKEVKSEHFLAVLSDTLSSEEFKEYFHQLNILFGDVGVIHVASTGDWFIVNWPCLCERLKEWKMNGYFPVICNVSKGLEIPERMYIIDKDIKKIENLIFHEVVLPFAASLSNNCLSSLRGYLVLEENALRGMNLTTIAGILLNYPVVYWYDNECGNCLGGRDLIKTAVTIDHEELLRVAMTVVCDSGPLGGFSVEASVVNSWAVKYCRLFGKHIILQFTSPQQWRKQETTCVESPSEVVEQWKGDYWNHLKESVKRSFTENGVPLPSPIAITFSQEKQMENEIAL